MGTPRSACAWPRFTCVYPTLGAQVLREIHIEEDLYTQWTAGHLVQEVRQSVSTCLHACADFEMIRQLPLEKQSSARITAGEMIRKRHRSIQSLWGRRRDAATIIEELRQKK